MLFSTPFFLFVFCPLFFALYWLIPFRAMALLLGSLFFYGWSEPKFIWIILASAIFDWALGWLIDRETRWKKFILAFGVGSNLGVLIYAKYAAFGVQNINLVMTMGGLAPFKVPSIALPLGVSFIVFEKITYLVDVYRGVTRPAFSLLSYLNYVFLFPKLLAGPIVKYHEISDQLTCPSHRYEDVRDGLIRFVTGLAKKVLLADFLALVADQVFSESADQLYPSRAWIGLVCFTLQIYFDFSGYSDMAIGLARMLGFRLRENFRDPYLAANFTDFWRRWHISLSTWIKEYLYIPLGGNRGGKVRNYANLLLCFFLCGLWHGPSWTFVVWGMYHGVWLIADKVFWVEWQKRLPRSVNIAITFVFVSLGFVLFRCETLQKAGVFFAALAGVCGTKGDPVLMTPDLWLVLCVSAACILAPLLGFQNREVIGRNHRISALAAALVLLIICTAWLGLSSFHPFLYFRF